MSSYSFIATDYEIPEIDNRNGNIITVKEAIGLGIKAHEFMPWEKMDPNDKILLVDKESDLGELLVEKGTPFEKNVRWYSDKPFIYSVYFNYTELRVIQLLEYIKGNIAEGHELELWSIWINEKQYIKPIVHSYNEISINVLKQMYNLK